MKLKTKLIVLGVAFLAAFSFASTTTVSAAKGDIVLDWSVYQGNYGKYGNAPSKAVIAQVGGTYNGLYVIQSTYRTQVSSAIAAGKHAHTYIWYQVGGSIPVAKAAMDKFLPMVQTPKGSIVALDYEAGASGNKQANTNAILYGLRRVKAAGYTPVLYSGKYYLNDHTYYSQINKAFPTSLWIASYPTTRTVTAPNFNYLPSYAGINMWQFTDAYSTLGLDASVDLTGITDNGYGKSTTSSKGKVTVKPKTSTSATRAGATANKATKASITAGTKAKVNLGARRWANGAAIPRWVRGRTYTVQQVSGNRVLLAGVLSWVDKSNIEILQTAHQAKTSIARPSKHVQAVKPSFAKGAKVKVNTSAKRWANGVAIPSWVHGKTYTVQQVGGTKVLLAGILSWINKSNVTVTANATSTATANSNRTYTVKYGDSWWSIATAHGMSMYTLASHNGKTIYSMIHPGDRLLIR